LKILCRNRLLKNFRAKEIKKYDKLTFANYDIELKIRPFTE